ncbi:MAG: protein phosphatase 2C domain-containing protein [Thermoanaerobaculia bacterium]|nr:protein phosphatase 2C domain-containing protein [Thermoanaerobaculia bacterium]
MTAAPEAPRLDVAGRSDVGLARKDNQDHFLTAKLGKSLELLDTNLADTASLERFRDTRGVLMAVADGVAGSSDGAGASTTAVRVLAEHVQEVVGCYFADVLAEDVFLVSLEEAVQKAHEKVVAESEGERGAATTLTLAVVVWPRAYLVHVGDSRLYLKRGERLRQITEDQTLAEMLVGSGRMSEEEAAKAGMGHVLTSAIGGRAAAPTVGLVDLEAGDTVLLCTDGLNRHVDDDRIDAILEACVDSREAVDALVEEALAGGGKDNVSVIVLRAG